MISLNLSAQQLKLLLQMVHLGEWVINSSAVPGEEDRVGRPYVDIYRQICKQVSQTKFADLVEKDDDSDDWYGSQKLEKSIENFLREYDEASFWDELIDALARRDTVEAGYSCHKDGDEVFFEALYPFLQKYEKEICDHGSTRLRIVPKTKGQRKNQH